jgi:penicillin-binding protein 1C
LKFSAACRALCVYASKWGRDHRMNLGTRTIWQWSGGIAVVGGMAAAAWVAQPIPPDVLAPSRAQSLTIEDRHGALLRTTRAADGSLASWVPLTDMDPDLPRAFVAVEDRRFYQHHGVDPRAVLRALRDNLVRGRVVSGASTITMQLARLVRPVGHGPVDKLVQALWAVRLEAHLRKNEILEQYLNRVPLGQGTVGVDAAMRLYFGGSPAEVSLGQAALLAALARAPSSQNPLVDPRRALERRSLGLRALAREHYAGPEETTRAGREPLFGSGRGRPFLAPHFTSRLLLWAEAEHRPLVGSWRTSLDLGLQAELEDEVRHTVDLLGNQGVRQGALVVLDNPSGEVLAWVGSPDFWADTSGQVDMVVSPRQPGSALKPFLYALAFDRGVTAATVLADIATTYQTSGGPYHPRNYDRRYHGPVRAREALASSYNVPAVGLTDRIGYATLLYGLRRAGFESLHRPADHYGLGLALGNGDVTLLELANGYRTLANGGVWSPTGYWAGEPGRMEEDSAPRRVGSRNSAVLVLDILSDPVARIPGFGLTTPFDWPFRAAAKTGTSRHFTDNWAVATTGRFTVAVWVGNFSGQPMQGVSGVTGAGPLLHRAVLVAARHYPPGDLPRPEENGLVAARICRVSGELASGDCPAMTEYFVPGTVPATVCRWHRDGEVRLPAEYAEWAVTAGSSAFRVPRFASARMDVGHAQRAAPPANAERGTRNAEQQPFRITSPQAGDVYRVPPGVDARYATVGLRAVGAPAGLSVRWFVDGHPARGDRWSLVPGTHRLRAESGAMTDEVEVVVE